MGFIIICIIFGLLAAWNLIKSESMDFDIMSITLFLSMGLIGSILGEIIYILAGGFIGYNLPTKDIVIEQEIYALNDSTSIEGANYLFSGYINENMVFRYVINTDKGKHIEEVKADNAYVNEGDYTPIVKIHKISFIKDWYNWFAYPVKDDYIEFFVPENTITNEYNINLH